MATDAFVRGKYERFKRPYLKGPNSTIVTAPLKFLTVAMAVMQANADSNQCESFWCPEPVHVYECSAFHVGWAAIASTVLVVGIIWKMVSMSGRTTGDRKQTTDTGAQTVECAQPDEQRRPGSNQSPTSSDLEYYGRDPRFWSRDTTPPSHRGGFPWGMTAEDVEQVLEDTRKSERENELTGLLDAVTAAWEETRS